MDDITKAIIGLTDRVVAYRAVRRLETLMPLEIKGLKANMHKVALRIESLNTKAQAFDALGADLEQGLDDISAQVKSHGEDMQFAATVLGNSTTQSGDTKDGKFLKPGAGNGADTDRGA